MADPTTILDYATQRRAQIAAAVTALQQRFTAAQSAATTAGDKLAVATSDFADLEKDIAAIRQKLAAVPTPADGEALLDELEQAIIASRAKRAELVSAQTALLAAQSESTLAQADLAVFSAQLTSASAALKQAEATGKQRTASNTALTGTLANIKAEAAKAIDVSNLVEGANFKAAKTRIGKDIPAKLLTRAQARRAAEAERIARRNTARAAAEEAVIQERDTNGGAAGMAADRWTELLRMEAEAQAFVSSAKSRFEQAKAKLAAVADPNNAPLTAEQKAQITDGDLKTDREAAADKEQAVADKRQDVEDAEDDLNQAILALKADPKNATKQAAVTTAEGVVTAAKGLLKTAEDDYKPAERDIMDAWEAAVPDTTWHLLDDYESAVDALKAMPNPVTLKTNLQTAEADYVGAQLKADGSTDILTQLTAEQAQRAARAVGAQQNSAASLFSALRGDN